MQTTRRVNGFTFKLAGEEENKCYEARGREVTNEYGDKMPEPAILEAGAKLKKELKSEGHNAMCGFSEKGWVEVWVD